MKYLSILVLVLSGLASYGENNPEPKEQTETRSKEEIKEERRALVTQLSNILEIIDKILAEETPEAIKEERDEVEKERESVAKVVEKNVFYNIKMLQDHISNANVALSNFRQAQMELKQTEGQGSGPCQYCDDPDSPSHASSVGLNDQTAFRNAPIEKDEEEVQPGTSTGTRK